MPRNGTELSGNDNVSYFPAHYYKRSFNFNGTLHSGYLTYVLSLSGQTQSERVYLLVDEEAIIPANRLGDFKRFKAEIDAESGGRFRQAKTLSRRILDDPQAYPHAQVAIHKYGPVPAFDLGAEIPVELHGNTTRARVLVYCGRSRFKVKPPQQEAELTVLALIKTLETNLPLIFRRYFEDVGESLRDIQDHANLDRAFERAKDCETLIGQSIQSKLRDITPSDEEWKIYENGEVGGALADHQRNRCELYCRYRQRIFLFTYARLGVLYALNELYSHLGLTNRSKVYADQISTLRKKLNERFGPGFVDEASNAVPELGDVHDALQAYFSDEARLFAIQPQERWTQRFVGFLRFLFDLRAYPVAPEKGRLFISYQLDVPSAETLKTQIETRVHQIFGDAVAVLTVPEQSADTRFIDLIRVRIWQSDRVLCIVPRVSETLSDGRPKDYNWIAREAEHALLLGKRVVFVCEDKFDPSRLEQDLGNEDMDFLVSNARARPGRAARLMEEFKNYPRVPYAHAEGSKNIDPRTAKEVDRNARRAMEMHQEHVVMGYLRQFTEEHRFLLACMYLYAHYPEVLTKKALAKLLTEQHPTEFPNTTQAERTITNAWNEVKNRSITIRGQELRAISLTKRRYYSLTLTRLLSEIPTDRQDKAMLTAKERGLLARVLSQNWPLPWVNENKAPF